MLQDHAKEVGYCSLDFEGFERVTNHLRYVLFCFLILKRACGNRQVKEDTFETLLFRTQSPVVCITQN